MRCCTHPTSRSDARGESVDVPKLWTDSTIRGQTKRGTGLINNELYIGRLVWNRLRYIRNPETGLAPDGLHEASGGTAADGPAAAAFLAAALVRLTRGGGRGTVLVCQSRRAAGRFGRLHGPGWRDLGLDPADLLVLRARRGRDVPWAMEEGLRSAALAAVLAEVESVDFTASRRLALAAREGLTPALLLRHDGLGPASAALTRWRVSALPGRSDSFDGDAPGPARWRLELVRCRGGCPAACDVEWNRETGDFGVAAALADRPAAPVPGTLPRLAGERKAG